MADNQAVKKFSYFNLQEVSQQNTEADVWHKKPFGVATVFAFSLLHAYWSIWHIPTPGKAVAALAVAAALMAFRGEMEWQEKVAWTLLLLAFLFLEIRSIDADHRARQREEAELRRGERASFARIMRQNQNAFNATMTQTYSLLDRTESISRLAEESLSSITGADSFAIITPQVWSGLVPIPLSIRNYGKHTLTGVTVSIRSSRSFNLDNPRSLYDLPTIQVGTLHPGELRTLKETITPIGEFKDENGVPLDVFDIDIAAQNFTAEEHLLFKKGTRIPWVFKYQVTRQYVKSQTNKETKFGYKLLANQKDWLGER